MLHLQKKYIYIYSFLLFRFPEFTQGLWNNIRVDGAAIRYAYVNNVEDYFDDGNKDVDDIQEDEGSDGDAVIAPGRRTRREVDSSDLYKSLETIRQSSPAMPHNFNALEFIKKHKLRNVPINDLNVIFIELFKPVNANMSIPNIKNQVDKSHKEILPSELTKPINLSNDRKKRSATLDRDNNDKDEEIKTYKKIAQLLELWDRQLKIDLIRASIYNFTENSNGPDHSIGKLPAFVSQNMIPSSATTGFLSHFFNVVKKDIESFSLLNKIKSIFGSNSYSFPKNRQHPGGPTPPPSPPHSPPPTPPQTPPRSTEITSDTQLERERKNELYSIHLLDDQTKKHSLHLKYDHDGGNTKTIRKKRCLWEDSSSAEHSESHFSSFKKFNQRIHDKTMDLVEKLKQRHDSFHNDQIHNQQNEPVKTEDTSNTPDIESTSNFSDNQVPTPSPPSQLPVIPDSDKIISFLESLTNESVFNTNPPTLRHRRSTDNLADNSGVNESKPDQDNTPAEDMDDFNHTMSAEQIEIEKTLKKEAILERERSEKFIDWLTNFRNKKMEFYRKRFSLDEKLKEVDFEKHQEMRPLPTVVDYLLAAGFIGIPYNQAINKWRAVEREHRMWLAQVEYIAYPGNNHPNIVLEDFDSTYDGIEFDFDPWHPEGTAKDPTAYLTYTTPSGVKISARQSRLSVWESKQKSFDNVENQPSDKDKFQQVFDAIPKYFPIPGDNVEEKSTHQRRPRNVAKSNQPQQMEAEKFAWRCVQPVKNEPQSEIGSKFLTYGGKMVEKNGSSYDKPQ